MNVECARYAESDSPGIDPVQDAQRDRFMGCLLGLAVGDALGATTTFKRPGTFTPIADMIGAGPFHLKPGQWGASTSMALCLAESVLACSGSNPVDQLRRYVRWYTKGNLASTGRCFYVGDTVRRALGRFLDTGKPCCGPTQPHAASNASIARLAPLAMAYALRPGEAIRLAAESSRTTHAMDLAVDACRYLSGLLVGALNGAGKHSLLAGRYSPIEGYWNASVWGGESLVPEIDIVASGSFRWRNPPEIRGAGHVVSSLEAALWAFDRSGSFEEGCLMAANLGGEADATCAVYGQIAGAYYGEAGIPRSWLDKLAMAGEIRSIAGRLHDFSRETRLSPAQDHW